MDSHLVHMMIQSQDIYKDELKELQKAYLRYCCQVIDLGFLNGIELNADVGNQLGFSDGKVPVTTLEALYGLLFGTQG